MATPLDPNLDSISTSIPEIQEIALTISAKNLNPTMLSEDFLKFSGIIPSDWELGKQPVLSPTLAQVSFQNGVSIVAQPRTITFMEVIGSKELNELQAPRVARQFIEKMLHAEYQVLSISPKSVVPFPGKEDAARKYITSTLLSPGPWQEFGKAPIQASLNLLYQLERCQLSLSINEARLQMPDQATVPALLFAGSFNYDVVGNTEQERLQLLGQGIDDWQSNLETFREIVNQRFLGQQVSVFPSSIM